MKLLICLAVFIFPSDGTISDSFRQFIRSRFGSTVEKMIARDDFSGGRGSYGGGNHTAEKKTR
jgi:hypothetical protein